MTIVEEVHQRGSLPPSCDAYARQTITLCWEDRRRRHGRRMTDEGLGFAISLPAGTLLKEGDCFALSPDRVVVEVKELLEPVYILRPKTPQQWAFYAYHVGNRHQSIMIGTDELIFLQNPAVLSLLQQLRADYTIGERPFTASLVGMEHA